MDLENAEDDTDPIIQDDGDETLSSDGEETESQNAVRFVDKTAQPGDYVLVEYLIRGKKHHYVGVVTQPKDDDGDFEVKFLRKSTKHVLSCCFVEPTTQEIVSVEETSIVGVLPGPSATETNTTKRRKGILQFDFSFSDYNMA